MDGSGAFGGNTTRVDIDVNWLIEEAEKVQNPKNRIILENPRIMKELDRKLTDNFWPFIWDELNKTSYPYYPHNGRLDISSEWMGSDLGRSLTFMQFDSLGYSFSRVSLKLSECGFMVKREFFLGLTRETEPQLILRLLSDERFQGMPPSLTVEESQRWEYYFHIKFEAGSGMESGNFNLDYMAKDNIRSVITDNVDMYELSMIDGLASAEDVETFLYRAALVYGDGDEL